MNCRKVSGLLSAYLDQELTVSETEVVSQHLEVCSLCRSEFESLRETKRMLSSLAFQTSREELEELLLSSTTRGQRGPLARLVPEWLSYRVAYWGSLLESAPSAASTAEPPSRFRAATATVLLSVAGVCLVSASLNGPREEAAASGMDAPPYALTLGSTLDPAAAAVRGAASGGGGVFLAAPQPAAVVPVHNPGAAGPSPAHPGWMPVHPSGRGQQQHHSYQHYYWHFSGSGSGYGIVPTRQTSFIYRYAPVGN